jgi:hypothetical protein
MLNGIIHRLGYRNHDIAIDVVIKLKFFFGIINEALNNPDVIG